jgi:hypothetical protein
VAAVRLTTPKPLIWQSRAFCSASPAQTVVMVVVVVVALVMGRQEEEEEEEVVDGSRLPPTQPWFPQPPSPSEL